ncbi:MAG: adenylyltransferase/cytidyltransferase family protein [Alphaproteobacteria bacterium]|nr:adenylyltransferase/cytidyltransferase family protein [Alphaproteobacteria bacterium]
MTDNLDRVTKIIKEAGLQGRALKDFLRTVVRGSWPDMPPWTTLPDGPVIEEVQKASFGSGVVLTFVEGGVRKAVLGQAGEHYRNPHDKAPWPDSYTIPGGFINLSATTGSTFVPPSTAPEDARTGAAREVEEEFKLPDGSPLLAIDPARLKPMDTKTIAFANGEKRVVMGLMLELTRDEVKRVKAHVAKLAADPAYRAAVAVQTVNDASGKPEVCDVKIIDLAAAVDGRCNLLHKDQQSLFAMVQAHFDEQARTQVRTGPTRAYQAKVCTLDTLKTLTAQWRAAGATTVGVTSGVFDIVHPGHISFLEDASRQSDRLIAVIASDRTVKAQKGAEKPYITALKRAQTIAALGTVDAVIISDEPYHETILAAVKPDVMFKGDDYAGKKIMGAELVGKVILIPCAEKEFYSSSAFVNKIKAGKPDKPPAWKPD